MNQNQFLRHPASVPIRYTQLSESGSTWSKNSLKELRGDGLSFYSSAAVDIGSRLRIEIRVKVPAFEAEAVVVWCEQRGMEYAIGVRFVDADAHFALRMVEQVCQIENYRSEVLQREGRRLSNEEAANEWIMRHARDFPR